MTLQGTSIFIIGKWSKLDKQYSIFPKGRSFNKKFSIATMSKGNILTRNIDWHERLFPWEGHAIVFFSSLYILSAVRLYILLRSTKYASKILSALILLLLLIDFFSIWSILTFLNVDSPFLKAAFFFPSNHGSS